MAMAKTEKFLLLSEVEGLEDIELRRTVPRYEEEEEEEEEEDCRRGRRPRKRAGERGLSSAIAAQSGKKHSGVAGEPRNQA